MRGKSRVALLVLLVALALLGAGIVLAPAPSQKVARGAPTVRASNADTLGPRSVFIGNCAADNPACEIQRAQGGINLVRRTECKELHLDKYTSGVALFTDAAKTKRLVPSDGVIREVKDGGHEQQGPYFSFTRAEAQNTFHVHVGGKFVRFGDSGAAELSSTPGPMKLSVGGIRYSQNAVLLYGAKLVGGVLRRGEAIRGETVTIFVAVRGSYATDVCASAETDESALYGENGTWFKKASDASRSDALYSCNHVGEWASKPRACDSNVQCELAFPDNDAPWCAWAARVDPTVAAGAEGAGQCCWTLREVKNAVPSNGKCAESERWVRVPYANGAFVATADVYGEVKTVEIPAYATIAILLSRHGHFSASCS